MALIQLLLEQFEAGPGAGQKQPEALEAETLGLEVSFAHEAPEEEGLVEKGARARTQAGTPSVPPPARQGKIESGTPAQSSQMEHGAGLGNAGTAPHCTFLYAGTKLRNSSTWPTNNQSE